jgi:hypothetical protein
LPTGRSKPTTTLRVNAHGCLVYLSVQPEAGQEVCLVNTVTQEQVECTVNFVAKRDARQTEVGLEFKQPSPFFWQMHFPPEDWNPDERKLPTAIAPSQPLLSGVSWNRDADYATL